MSASQQFAIIKHIVNISVNLKLSIRGIVEYRGLNCYLLIKSDS